MAFKFGKPEKGDLGHVEDIVSGKASDLDVAYSYLQEHKALNTDHVALKPLRRKIDRNIVPLMFFIHLTSAIDGQLLNYAIVMGMPDDLGLHGEQINNIASSIKWVHLAACAVVGLFLNKFPLGTSLGWSIFIWAILISCTAAVQSYAGFMAIRLLMGLFDSLFHPSMMLITSMFYLKDEQITRFQLWWCSQGFAQILGALISYAFQFVHKAGFESWRIMYLTFGAMTFLISIWTIIWLPNSPMTAKFLSIEEKVAQIRHIAPNQTGVSNHHIKPKQIFSILGDPQVWLLCSMVIITGFGSGIISNFSSLLIRSFGYSRKEATLLNAPGGAVQLVACFVSTWAIRRKYLQRWSMIGISYAVAFLGSCLLAFAPRHDKWAHLCGLWLFYFSSATVGIKFQWNAANIAGHTKRPVTMAMMSASYTIGSIAGPYAVLTSDKPEYHTALYGLVGAKGSTMLLVLLLALYYLLENRKRDRKYGKRSPLDDDSTRSSDDESEDETWANLTDKERHSFRYVY